jgi:hypothetical protein
MNKDKWRSISKTIIEKLQFLKLDDDMDVDDDIEIEEKTLSEGRNRPEDDLRERLARSHRWAVRRRIALVVLVVLVLGGFWLYNRIHTFTDYVITDSYENEVASGTEYVSVGKNIYRYNSDGVSCVSRKNVLKWSLTYNMQAPIIDICEDKLVIAEQQGNQIYIVDADGQVGNFETLLPILKVRVSSQGIVAVVLQEDDVTWVNLYEADGTSIASDKTTVTESGYPLDIDLSPNGQKLAVSYLTVEDGIVRSDVVFYDFGTVGQSKENYIVSSISYQETVIPELYFTDNSRAIAIADDGYIVFTGSDAPEESTRVNFEEEIISTFHDEDGIGFLFRSDQEDYDYRMELYNYRGKRKMSKDINASFDRIKMENDQILLYSSTGCSVFTTSGQERFVSSYEKEISELFYFSEFRRYLVVTKDSFDRIRIS